MALTPKQEAFVREYLVDLNAAAAAVRAGYSEKTAKQQAFQLSQKAPVQAAITAAMAQRAKKVELDSDWVLARLKLVSDRCVQGEPVCDAEGNETGEWKFDAAGACRSTELIGKHLGMFKDKVEVTGKDGGPLEVEVSDARQRLAERLQRARPRPDPSGDG